ncbi:ATP-dependent DNA helicase PIF1 [Trichonephila clavata]|uniref:ATP-dependent DNA helicase n=1 Tax=Trichonephila clavata TaxID=2740835 RepID=A0A8X6I167_TRICU|nr:ATP-dependent DNA helicase PIF1 [Trichonephila clavata]
MNQEAQQENFEEELEMPEQHMTDDEFLYARRAMNVGQMDVFLFITRSISEQLNNQSDERLRLFITGNAGTGTTFLFNLLKSQVNRCYGKQVVKVSALAGVAARLVGGSTLHSTLKLPVQKDSRIVQMPILTGNYLRLMRQQWQHTEFLFIDEISMVPYEMLCMLDSRLKQLKNNELLFGGINICVFGDLMQLPPVRGNQVFDQPSRFIPATHLWRSFSLIELTENMRQQGSTTFKDLLNALRIGELQSEHLAILMNRLNKEPTGEFVIEKALRIYPTNQQVYNHNKTVLEHFRARGVTINKIIAQDSLVDSTQKNDNIDLNNIIPSDINKTGGLPKKLEIFVGAKVMLRYNVDASKGLVNGAIGHITEIIWPCFRRALMYDTDIPSVRIDFGKDGAHLIQPKTVQFPAKYSHGTAERRMLPIILCWACTVHKMQGSTVDHAVVYLGSKLFAAGQAYVALSRVKSLEGLLIEELDCSKLTGKRPCNNDALNEMHRLRNLSRDY